MKDFVKAHQNLVIGIFAIMLGILGGLSLNVSFKGEKVVIKSDGKLNIELTNPIPALISDENGEEHEELLPTIVRIDNGEVNTDCPDGECGKGAYYPNIDVTTPSSFQDSTLGKPFNTDDWAGCQCYDLVDLLMQNLVGRHLKTGGTGKVKDAWNIAKDYNKGTEFDEITNPEDIEDGDIVFFSTGYYGHTGMARGRYNNGYISLLGENQGGNPCDGGGSSTTLVNISTRDFLGALRYKGWHIEPEPEPEPEIVPDIPDTGITGRIA